MHDPTPRDRALITLRIAALIGLCITGYLLYLAMTGQTAPGCGEGGGACNKVLASPWSRVLGLPVAAPAVAAYTVILAASIHAGPRNPERHRAGAWRIIGFVALAAGASALWFIAVQLFILGGVCVYCMAAHACSLALAGIALSRSRGIFPRLGPLAAGALIATQSLVPPTLPTIDQAPGIFGQLDPNAAPTLGDPAAPYAIALLFDYNCAYCRDAHAVVDDAVQRYNGRLVAVMLPTALDPACNPGAKVPGPHSKTSCEFARLALAVWLADPSKFHTFDRQLVAHADAFGDPDAAPARYLNQARALAEQHVTAEQLDATLTDPRLDEILEVNGMVYARATYLGSRGVPRLIVNGHPLPGLAEPDQLDQLLEQAYPGLAADQ